MGKFNKILYGILLAIITIMLGLVNQHGCETQQLIGLSTPTITITPDSGYNNTDTNWSASWSATDYSYNYSFWDKNTTTERVLLAYSFGANFSGTTIVNHGSWGTNGTVYGTMGTSHLYWINNATFGEGTGYFQFGASTHYINSTRRDNITRPFTTCVSVLVNSFPSTGGNVGLFSKWDSTLNKRSWMIYVSTNSTGSYIKGGTSSTGSSIYSAISSVLSSTADWFDVCLVATSDPSNLLYINGLLNASTTPSSSTIYATNQPIIIGMFMANGSASNYFNGTTSNVVLYNWSLSASQIAERYDALLDRRSQKLVADETEVGDNWTLNVIISNGTSYSTTKQNQGIGDVTATTPATLYVNISHPDCDDSHTRLEASSLDTPWCSLDAPLTNDKMLSGDTLYICKGEYKEYPHLTSYR